jgi:hypothetical protein
MFPTFKGAVLPKDEQLYMVVGVGPEISFFPVTWVFDVVTKQRGVKFVAMEAIPLTTWLLMTIDCEVLSCGTDSVHLLAGDTYTLWITVC